MTLRRTRPITATTDPKNHPTLQLLPTQLLLAQDPIPGPPRIIFLHPPLPSGIVPLEDFVAVATATCATRAEVQQLGLRETAAVFVDPAVAGPPGRDPRRAVAGAKATGAAKPTVVEVGQEKG
jgi:hypothetical protein